MMSVSDRPFRNLRRWLTAGAAHATWKMAPIAPRVAIDAVERILGRIGPTLPVIARIVKTNMQTAGVYDRTVFNEYFRQVALHLANATRIFRNRRQSGAVDQIAQREIIPDDTIEYARQAANQGRGAIIVPAHACNFLISLARLGQDLPICIFLRWSKDRHRLEMKRQWCQTAGLDVIVEPENATDPTSRAAACIDAVRAGKLLVITPDIAQRDTEGVPVQWLGRKVYLPAGPAALAMLAEVPMIPLFAKLSAASSDTAHRDTRSRPARAATGRPIHVPTFGKPIIVDRLSREEGGRKEAIRRAMQTWADGFDRFIRECPPAWLLWGDSRWTRVFRGDPRYAGRAGQGTNPGAIQLRQVPRGRETPA